MVEPGFVKADSSTLPKVDIFMIGEFLKRDDRFNAAEIKGAKAAMASREAYGDQAVGYVQVKRNGLKCIVKGKICPEHKIRSRAYSVSLVVDEGEEKVVDVECFDCAAASGGCKHSLAFLMWVHRRSEDPAPTDTECYWKKSTLAGVGTSIQYVEVKQFAKRKILANLPDNTTFLNDVVAIAKDKQLESALSCHNFEISSDKLKSLSIYQLMIKFHSNGGHTAAEFLKFSESHMSEVLCREAEISTQEQRDVPLWHELRYGRITASKFYEAAHCHTPDGSLIKQIIGASKIRDTKAMARGRKLEDDVLEVLKRKHAFSVKRYGLQLLKNYPILGASPDGVTNDFILEIKCPISDKTFKNYICNGLIQSKYKAQMHLQMFATNKKKGLFCVACPNFEKSKIVHEVWLDYDEKYCMQLVADATAFWKDNVFPKIFSCVTKH